MTDLTLRIHANNLVTWLEIEALRLGTDEQRERWARNILPEDELLQAARAEIYKVFESAARFQRLTDSDVKHTRACKAGSLVADNRVKYETADVTEMSKEAFAAYQQLERQADVLRTTHRWFTHGGCKVKIDLRTHWAECSRCHAEAFRSSASIRITWAGRELAREYGL